MNESLDVIYSYSRSEAIEDGVLIDITDLAKEAGFRYPVAVSANLYHNVLTPAPSLIPQGQSLEGRIWDMLNVLRASIKPNQDTLSIIFAPIFTMAPDMPPTAISIISAVGPGDNLEPVLTIFLPEDD